MWFRLLCLLLLPGCGKPIYSDAGTGYIKGCARSQCDIDNRCYKDGETQKTNPCHVCDPGLSPVSWAPAPGCVVTLAGKAKVGSHNDGKVTGARFNRPRALALAPDGTLHVSDDFNDRIRTIKGGNVTSVTSAIPGARGLAVYQKVVVHVADSDTDMILEVDGSVTVFAGSIVEGYLDGSRFKARFKDPHAVAWHDGMMYVADHGNNAIRRVADDQVSTHSGGSEPGLVNGDIKTARYSGPTGIFVDASGIYVTESGNNAIRHIVGTNVSTLAGGKKKGFSHLSTISCSVLARSR